MAALDEPAEEAEDPAADGGDTDVERQDGAATAREAHAQELLSDDQINQVGQGAMQCSACFCQPKTKVFLHAKASATTRPTRWGEQHRSNQQVFCLSLPAQRRPDQPGGAGAPQ